MNTTYRSFAKINLHLEVRGRRDDGYHELVTLFQTVDLTDLIRLEITDSDRVDLTVSEGEAPADSTNLAYRAAARFLRRWAPGRGVRIDLKKRIPMGGGVGGGSSNAAAVLIGLQDLLSSPVDEEELLELAAELGADVPYFLSGGTALGVGRGDKIRILPDLPERPIWLVIPPLSLSTPVVFDALRPADLAAASARSPETWIEQPDWPSIPQGRNDLEETVFDHFPMMQDVYNAVVEAGASMVRLSGTGATLFAFFESDPDPGELSRSLPSQSRVVQTRTLTRSSVDRLRVVQ